MKIEQVEEIFNPITITIETKEEMITLMRQMCVCPSTIGYNFEKLMESLDEVLDISTNMFSELEGFCKENNIEWVK